MGNCKAKMTNWQSWSYMPFSRQNSVIEKIDDLKYKRYHNIQKLSSRPYQDLMAFFMRHKDVGAALVIGNAIFSRNVVNLREIGFTAKGVAPGTQAELWKTTGVLPGLFRILVNFEKGGRTEITPEEMRSIGWTENKVFDEIEEILKSIIQNQYNGTTSDSRVGGDDRQAEVFFAVVAKALVRELSPLGHWDETRQVVRF